MRAQVLGGGAYLVLRQGLGIALSLLGLTLLLKQVGPKEYGLYSLVLGIYTYLFSVGQMGVGVYLVRREGRSTPEDFQQAFTFLAVWGTVLALLVTVALPLLERWLALEAFSAVALAVFAGLPLGLATLPLLAYLERELNFKRVALVELGGQLVYYAIALLLAHRGFGVWALVWGWWGQQLWVFFRLRKAVPIPLRPSWDWWKLKDMVGYGLGFSSSIWVWQLRGLVAPLIVGKYLGPTEVGYIGLATRLVESIAFVKAVAWRVSVSAFARVQSDKPKLARAIVEASELQVLATGLPLLVFTFVGPYLVPSLLGPSWMPVILLFPFIAVGYIVNAVFNMHSSALYVLRRNLDVTLFHFFHVALFALSSWVGVREWGLLGYGWAEVLALLSYVVVSRYAVRAVGPLDQRVALLWASSIGIALFWQSLGLWALLPMAAVFFAPFSRAKLAKLWREVTSSTTSGVKIMFQEGEHGK
ncbi:polysaccharide biosynthesis protein [Thermus thermophilus]|nr:polysaccharide biosynthesis protein [Thermus thermophilus]BDB11800.1 hypothetical protein TthTMY_15390 [Thermus thermophilus]